MSNQNKNISVENLLTVAQYAAQTGVTSTTVYNKIKAKELQTVKVGKITFIVTN